MSASTTLQMKLTVGTSQNGSTTPVVRSGMSAMSPDLTLRRPTLDPSKPMPADIRLGVNSLADSVTWCQRPHRSLNLRSIMRMPLSRTKAAATSKFLNTQ